LDGSAGRSIADRRVDTFSVDDVLPEQASQVGFAEYDELRNRARRLRRIAIDRKARAHIAASNTPTVRAAMGNRHVPRVSR
jgi:hypothetical protein